ncbi:MAG: bifunctional phosphopantothenoylcysteine decarboxylase/phosphopantothenate--cysteine ligase CoaBC [Coriobacteriales bacterium]|jgi:phosphopantothenoylcysteine decarboxylase/phosphopantothenate--cysteine ligase|nr:bifunctional phosphopantothenoylcysteine decarboxylase/phosphopantothenate--cysteine ligase CoaBC [Coriobacteriales bacterium]
MEEKNKTVLLGVTGSIAAYKACEIVSLLKKRGLKVKVVMTEHAAEFVGPATFRTLTGEPVALELFDKAGDPIHHISLAKEADLICIAPATANLINKLAAGVADDLLTTTVLAATCPVLIAPAMNTAMLDDVRTQASIKRLRELGAVFIEPMTGELACGDVGRGHIAEVEEIVADVMATLSRKQRLAGHKLLITAGPTHEYLDPIRFFSNPSSGKTGFAIAEAARQMGARVTLVTGPVALTCAAQIKRIDVVSAREMYEAALASFAEADVAICTAAVSDYRPAAPLDHKLKKADFSGHLDFLPNPDILAALGKDKGNRFLVGFAAETTDLLANAKAKLIAKHADLIVANDVSAGQGFGIDQNQVTFVSTNATEELPMLSKRELADRICDYLALRL